MSIISVFHKGNFNNLEKLLKKSMGADYRDVLEKYAEEGVAALSSATPVDTGETAGSWDYEIVGGADQLSIYWTNSHINKNVNIAIILQTGHGTGTGGYVQGRDYINPALRPIFDAMADAAWKEVTGV